MKILIDTGKFKPSENNLLVYRDNKWVIISRHEYLAYQDKILLEQSKKIDALEKELKLYKEDITKKINTMAKSIKTILGE